MTTYPHKSNSSCMRLIETKKRLFDWIHFLALKRDVHSLPLKGRPVKSKANASNTILTPDAYKANNANSNAPIPIHQPITLLGRQITK